MSGSISERAQKVANGAFVRAVDDREARKIAERAKGLCNDAIVVTGDHMVYRADAIKDSREPRTS